jgi:sugar transferase (PEP-CTERM system associated)
VRIFGVIWHVPLIMMAVCFTGALWLAPFGVEVLTGDHEYPAAPTLAAFATLFSLLGLAITWALGLYSRRQRARLTGLGMRAFGGTLLAGLLAYVISRMTSIGEITGPNILIIALVAALVSGPVVALISSLIDDDIFRRKVLVYGCGIQAQSIAALRRRVDQRGFRIVGFVRGVDEVVEVAPERLVSPNGSLLQLAREIEADEIVMAMDDRRRNFPLGELLECRLAGIEIIELVTFLERETGKVHIDVLNPSWLIFGAGFRRDVLRRYSERIFDVLASTLLLLAASPVMLLTALAIVIESGPRAPIFYRQKRVGFRGSEFDVVKFRSMRVDAEKNGAVWATDNDSRVTRVGTVIRKLRIDELPQILNVLKGDMSFVGPRPERPEFVRQLSESIPYYNERHWVKPGITGWAQLCYPYGASERDAIEKLQYDLYYVKNHSLLFDIMVLAQTAEVVLLGKGAR